MLNRLENKGNNNDPNLQILKLNEVRKLRIKSGIKLKERLFLCYDQTNVLDSSHLIGARRILKHVVDWRERKAKLALAEKSSVAAL